MTDRAEQRLIDAIHRRRLGATASEIATGDPSNVRAASAVAAARRIADAVALEHRRVAELLERNGIAVAEAQPPEFEQRHIIEIRLDRDAARHAATILTDDGFRRHPHWRGGAEASFWATADELLLARTDRWTTVVRLRWTAARRLPRVIRPRPGDWAAVALPGWAWWAYSVVRPIRLLLERTGLRRRDHAALEPFLATPASLIEPLLDLADVGPDDLIADIGCGDGRILIDAVRSRGCRAIGAEYSPELVHQARAAVAEAGLDDRIDIVEGDGLALPLDDVTVALLFLPMVVASRVVPTLLERMPSGARVVTHEQAPLPDRLPPPTSSRALIGADAVSVGHRWDV